MPTNNTNSQLNYPFYIVSKGRWESRHTSKVLERLGVSYLIIVEEQEYIKYCRFIDKKKIIVLDKKYQDDYDTFDDLSDQKSKGPGPARNFAWDHAVSLGFDYHWVADDNIYGFFRFNKNLKVPVADGTIFRCMEDFVRRYENVDMAGPNYFMFAARKTKTRPFILNTRIYSCNFIKNNSRFRWRGRYNEDTDLSLRMLKAGRCTVLFNAFLQDKAMTQTIAGGNTKEFYEKEGTLAKSKMLVDMHPDVSRLAWRWGRPHHFVDYKVFKNINLRRNNEVDSPVGTDNYGMNLEMVTR